MANGKFKIPPDDVRTMSTKIKEEAEEYKTSFENIYKEISILNDSYAGAGADSFNAMLNEDRPNFEKIYNALISCADQAKKLADDFESEDKAHEQKAKNL